MLYHIIRKEMLLNLVSFRFIISISLLFVLVVGSMNIMAVNYGRRLQDYSVGADMHATDLASMNSRPQFEAFGVTKDPRPAMLGIFSIGLDPQMSRSISIPGFAMGGGGGGGGRIVFSYSKLAGVSPEGSKYANPIFNLFQPPDFIYIVNIVLSLLAILFAFDCISGEKENQTLKLMLTNSIPRDVILIGKWIGGTLSLLIPFIISFGIGFLTVMMRPNVDLSNGAGLRVLLILLLSLLFIAVFFLVGMVFSTFAARSSTALITSLFAWVFFVIVIPNIAPVISRQFVPIKTSDSIVREAERMEQDMTHEIWKKERSDEEQKKMVDKMHKDLPEKVRALEDRWLNSLTSQVKLAMNISRISPSADYIFASTAIAGTGVDDYQKLRDEILRYRTLLSDNRKIFIQNDDSKPIPMLYINILMDKVPVFEDRRLDVASSVNNAIVDFAILSVYMIVLFLIAFLKFLNYDVK
ncbi:MAG: ABC transporter permease subunit [bacterium]